MSVSRRFVMKGSLAALTLALPPRLSAQVPNARVTILYDAFGKPSDLKRGWGFSSLIEYGGRRILFDTGAKTADFASNVNALGIDLKNLDLVVLSHRHGDHTAGLSHVLSVNSGVAIYTPAEGAAFGTPLPPALAGLIQRRVDALPEALRYFGGNPPADNRPDSPWPGAHFMTITAPSEVLPGFVLVSTRSETPGTMEMNEISIVIKTPKGAVVVVGCSHPGIEKILESASKIDGQIYSVFGGFHLVDVADSKVTDMVTGFRDKWHIERLAAGHCTGQFAFMEMVRIYGSKFDQAGVGSVIPLPI